MMHEADVLKLLYQSEIKRMIREKPISRVIRELVVLRGLVRVDVAVINDSLHGFEIKSASDNLARLTTQQAAYGKVFERMTIVADERHVEEAVKLLPPFWGLIAVRTQGKVAEATEIWPARINQQLDKLALAQLLWREEALELMEYFGIARGMKGRSRKVLWQHLAKSLTVEELKAFVCYKLRTRKGWR